MQDCGTVDISALTELSITNVNDFKGFRCRGAKSLTPPASLPEMKHDSLSTVFRVNCTLLCLEAQGEKQNRELLD